MTTVTHNGVVKKTVCNRCGCTDMTDSKSFGNDTLKCAECGCKGWKLVPISEEDADDKVTKSVVFAY